jgi:hypothetical protein
LSQLRQGEILTNVNLIQIKPATLGTSEIEFLPLIHPIAFILTQDCDLEQDFHVRHPVIRPSDKLLPTVLLCQVFTAVELRGDVKKTGINSAMWNRISLNKDERYHFLQRIEQGADRLNEGLPELAIDFKKYFTIPTDELYRRIEIGEAQRRCVLISPYMEHLCDRYAAFLSRIALPLDHVSE